MTTFGNIGLAEPSTITKVVAAVVVARGSTSEYQEILCIGDPTSSGAVANVTSSGELKVTGTVAISGNSTVVQGTSPWVVSATRINIGSTAADNAVSISGNSTVIQGTSPWVIGGNSSVRANLSSTAADNPVSISGNSTVIQGTNPWVVTPSSTNWASSAGFHFTSSGELQVAGTFSASTQVAVSSVAGIVTTQPNSTGWAGSAGFHFTSSGELTVAATLTGSTIVTISAVSGSAGKLNIGSTAADNAVLISGNSTVAPLAGSVWSVSGNSSTPPSSNSSALNVRPVIDSVLTFCSTNALASSLVAINSTATGQKCRVFAYSFTSTVQTPTTFRFYGGSSLKWALKLAALSSAVTGANLAVTPPAYLFQCAAGSSMTLRSASSIAGVVASVSYFMSP